MWLQFREHPWLDPNNDAVTLGMLTFGSVTFSQRHSALKVSKGTLCFFQFLYNIEGSTEKIYKCHTPAVNLIKLFGVNLLTLFSKLDVLTPQMEYFLH